MIATLIQRVRDTTWPQNPNLWGKLLSESEEVGFRRSESQQPLSSTGQSRPNSPRSADYVILAPEIAVGCFRVRSATASRLNLCPRPEASDFFPIALRLSLH